MNIICKRILQGQEKKTLRSLILGLVAVQGTEQTENPEITCQEENNRWIRERNNAPSGDESDEENKVGELS